MVWSDYLADGLEVVERTDYVVELITTDKTKLFWIGDVRGTHRSVARDLGFHDRPLDPV